MASVVDAILAAMGSGVVGGLLKYVSVLPFLLVGIYVDDALFTAADLVGVVVDIALCASGSGNGGVGDGSDFRW